MIARPPSLECASFANDCQTYFCGFSSKCEINSHGNPRYASLRIAFKTCSAAIIEMKRGLATF